MNGASPAFPYRAPGFMGLTKREWFAGQALAGFTAGTHTDVLNSEEIRAFAGYAANYAVAYADALIAALNKSAGVPPALEACKVALEVIENRRHDVSEKEWDQLEGALRAAIKREGGEA